MAAPRRILLAAAAAVTFCGTLPGADRIRAGEGAARPGAGPIPIAIGAANDKPIQGLSVSLWFPPGEIKVAGVTYAGTAIEPLLPEHFSSTVDAGAGNVSLAAIFEVSAPYDLVSLPPSPNSLQTIAVVLFDVQETAGLGLFPLRLADGPGRYPIRNVFVDMGANIFPVLEDGSFSVLPRRFRRGYLNADGRIDISDGIFLLDFFFLGGEAPECMAAADVNGDHRDDLSDMIWLLAWFFLGGSPPPEPFERCGDDPRGPSPLSCPGQTACQ